MFGTTLAAAGLSAFATGDPASARSMTFAMGNATAATLVGPTPSPFGLIGGAIAFFISDGTEENPDAGLLFGDGWDSTTPGVDGGRGGLLFGNGGDGADGDATNPDGSDGGRGGLLFGDGGDGGNGFSVTAVGGTCDRRRRRNRRRLRHLR